MQCQFCDKKSSILCPDCGAVTACSVECLSQHTWDKKTSVCTPVEQLSSQYIFVGDYYDDAYMQGSIVDMLEDIETNLVASLDRKSPVFPVLKGRISVFVYVLLQPALTRLVSIAAPPNVSDPERELFNALSFIRFALDEGDYLRMTEVLRAVPGAMMDGELIAKFIRVPIGMSQIEVLSRKEAHASQDAEFIVWFLFKFIKALAPEYDPRDDFYPSTRGRTILWSARDRIPPEMRRQRVYKSRRALLKDRKRKVRAYNKKLLPLDEVEPLVQKPSGKRKKVVRFQDTQPVETALSEDFTASFTKEMEVEKRKTLAFKRELEQRELQKAIELHQPMIGFKISGRRTRTSKSKSHKYETYYKGKWVGWGAKGYKIKPGTAAGHSFCARSLGLLKKHPGSAKTRIARAAWGCRGKRSYKVKRR